MAACVDITGRQAQEENGYELQSRRVERLTRDQETDRTSTWRLLLGQINVFVATTIGICA